ncbi:MAG TPA: tRNA uridine-5-carboxymethylaminomethyl(34) synthesis GTPase MnmE [Gemmatimonadales bacterium]|nr:tRNA uridine-5-carboxymethylaminomethyl(34) synthesis GTPase MnmE [Gemmatimonadales bacterium]
MLSDPIAALATPPGRSALAVVRLGGRGAFEVARRVIRGFRTEPARTATLATFQAPDGSVIDRGLYAVFPAPASYTGEDMVELSCHGGLAVPGRLLAALHTAGARPADPGEFTRRAVLNGKLDLVQAEAVGDLIDATTPAQARAALGQLEGGLSRRLEELRNHLVELQALLGYDIDFPDEDDGPVSPERISRALAEAEDRVGRLLATGPWGERLREGALVVFAGRPNVGKSSLFNALLGTERALVTEIPGTTRDAIEAAAEFHGWPVRLVDTAGLQDAADRIERLGIEVSRRYLAAADLVLLCAEAGRPLGSDESGLADGRPGLVVRTKADLAPAGAGELAVSCVSGAGLDVLRRAVAERIFGERVALADLEPALTRQRHRDALARARDALEDARPHLGRGGDAVLVAHHVRRATLALDELVGAVDVDEVLGRVFASFCVGK